MGVVVLLCGMVVSASPASGAVGNLTCDAGEICVWLDDNFSGCFDDFVPPNQDSTYTNGSPTWNNCSGQTMNDHISSYKNLSSHWGLWYVDSNYVGRLFCAEPGSTSGNLGNFGPPSPEDQFSSHKTATSQPWFSCYWVDLD